MKKLWLMLAMMVCVLAACSDGGSDNPVNPTPKPEEVKTEITIDSGIVSNGLSFTASQSEHSISFSVNADWTLSVASTTSGATWCKASATSGSKGSANVKFTIDENTSYDDRSVSVTIKAGTVSKTFTITQKGADAMLVTTTKYEVAQEGGRIEVEVKANIDYRFAISETAKDWITESKSKSRSLTTYKHTFEIALNEEFEKREGEISFIYGDKVETVKIYQAGGAVILLSKDEYIVSDVGETISVDIKSNVDFGVQVPDIDWITDEASSRGMSSHALNYVVAPNEGYDSRSAEIIFYDKNSALKDTLKVTQVQKDAILLSKNSYKIEQLGGIVELDIKANVEYEVEISDSAKIWIEESYSRTLMDCKHFFKVYPNEEYDDRMGQILFKSGNISQVIQIHQKGGPILKLLNKNYFVKSKGDTINVEIESNLDFDIKMPDVDWIINYSANRGMSKKSIGYIIKPNSNSEQRNAEIIYFNEKNHVSDTLYISQSPRTNIILSEKEIITSWIGTFFRARINENVEFPYTIEMPDDKWVYWTSMTKGAVDFSIDYNNKTNSSRSTSIIFRSKELDVADTLKITQKASGGFLYGYLNSKYGKYFLGLDSLVVDFPINGLDHSWLRQMMGGNEFYEQGKLRKLNLANADIIRSSEKRDFKNADGMLDTREYVTWDDIVGNFKYCFRLNSIILPNSAVGIYSEAFYGCENLEEVVFGTGVHTIEDYAFKNCYKLKNVVFPDNVVVLGKNLFEGCNLENVKLGNKIETIGERSFCNSRLREIYMPDNIINIGDEAFVGCWGLSVTFSRNLKQIGNGTFNGCGISELILPNSLETIGDDAFRDNHFVEISIPNSVTLVGKNAFYRCQNLKTVTLGNGINRMSDGMFFNCYNLENVFISDNVDSIGIGTFQGCRKLTNITLTKNVTSIGSKAFCDCTTLKKINLQDVKYIDDGAFQNCMSLDENLKLENVLSIGKNAFSGCKSLTNVVVGKGVKVVSAGAFQDCKKLKHVVLGENVTRIDGSAFSNTIIESLYIYSSYPPKVSGAFDQSWSWGQDSLRILYVPKGSLSAYKSSEWRNYFDGIKEMD